MDLQPLQIDRTQAKSTRRRGRPPILRWVALVVCAALLYVFRRPLLELADRWRLPEVQVIQVVSTSPLAAGAISGTAANGYVVARVRAALSADTPGRIVEMNVEEGSLVKKGDVVARLYADEYRADLERAEKDLEASRAVVESRRAQREVAGATLERLGAGVRRAEADLAETVAALAFAERELERVRELIADGIATQGQVDLAESEQRRALARRDAALAALDDARGLVRGAELELQVAESTLREAETLVPVKEAERDRARATLDKTEVRAPFDGIVVLKDAEVGEVVSPNAVGSQSRGSVATMVDLASLEVQVELPETNLAAVEVGKRARIFLDAYPEQGYDGEVLRIWPTANRQKATVEVRVGFANPDERLRPEMGARVVFLEQDGAPSAAGTAPSAEPARIWIPAGSVVRIDGTNGVFTLERNVARFRPLELGPEERGRFPVLSGLESGERIVADPPDSLEDGDRVRVQE